MEFELRGIMADDLFTMVKILRNINIKELNACFETDDVKKAMSAEKVDVNTIGKAVGLDIASVFISNLPACKDDLYKFLGDLAGMKPAEIGKLEAADFIELIMQVIKKKEFTDFFLRASKLLK